MKIAVQNLLSLSIFSLETNRPIGFLIFPGSVEVEHEPEICLILKAFNLKFSPSRQLHAQI